MSLKRRLLFCGGGVRVIGHIGALEVLSAAGELGHIKEYCGVSAGALLAMCLAIGYTLAETRSIVLGFDFTNVMDSVGAPGFIMNFGIDTGSRLQRMVEACIHVKGLSPAITFKELKTGLRVYATNLNTAELVEFSAVKTPDIAVADAVRSSMSFPYYFQPYVDVSSGHHYGDGGIISNFPMHLFTEDQRAETIGFLFNETCTYVDDLDFTTFIMRPFILNMQSRSHNDMRVYGADALIIDMTGIGALEFDIDKAAKEGLLERGRKAAGSWLSRKKSLVSSRRRHSIG